MLISSTRSATEIKLGYVDGVGGMLRNQTVIGDCLLFFTSYSHLRNGPSHEHTTLILGSERPKAF